MTNHTPTRSTARSPNRSLLIRSVLTIAACGTLLFGAATLASSKTRPAPETLVGFQKATLDVSHRNRALDVHIWYPASANSTAQATPQLIAQNALMYGFHAHLNAEPRAGQFPLILLSHGSGGRMTQLAWLATQLAEQGYIVAGANHHGTTSGDSDPHRTVQIWERTADQRALLDAFESGDLADMPVDMGSVTSAGFSLGGHTALALSGARVHKAAFIQYCAENAGLMDCGWLAQGGVDFNDIDRARYEADFADPRITATFAIDPALPQAMSRESLAQMNLPALLINLGDDPHMPLGIDAAPLANVMPDATRTEIAGSWHFSALGECSPLGRFIIGVSGYFTGESNICGEAARHRREIHKEILEQVTPFLENAARKTARVSS